MKKRAYSLRKITLRYSVLVSGLLTASMALVGYFYTRQQNRILLSTMKTKAKVIMKNISANYADAILKKDTAAISTLSYQLWSSEQPESLSLYDANGRCIWSLYSELEESSLPETELKKLKGGGNFLLERIALHNASVYEATIPIGKGEKLSGFLKIDFPLRDFYQRLRGVYYLLAMVSGGFLIANIFWSWFTSNTILHSLDKLTEGVKKVYDGDFSANVSSSPPRELAILTENFNQLVTRLRNTRDELKRHQASLEERVKKITIELEETHKKLLQSEKLAGIGQLAAGVAHEINNPLTSISMLSQLLLDKEDREADLENLRELLKQSRRCQKIVRGLLSFARDRNPNFRVLDLKGLIKNCLLYLRKQKGFERIELIAELDEKPVFVDGDYDQLAEVFTNILMNAEQSMDSKGRIILRSFLNHDTVRLKITDTGCGIPGQNLDRIFEPFFTSTKKGNGIGLGLSISYGIIRKHHGNIEVKSKIGEGTTFTVTLPTINAAQASAKSVVTEYKYTVH